jgi:hypothetical protein
MSIYVISNELNIEKNMFKVGRTKDTTTEIVTKYQRYLSGARLLLWYPSTMTKYVEDEREILRMFNSNRNRTPNGFKNEWLSIPFEQLKTKMDEYFGHDGEDFEEEQKRERERGDYKCIYCGKQLSTKHALQRHHNVCSLLKIQTQKEQYEQQIHSLKEQYEQQIHSLKEQYEQQIHSLKEQYEHQQQREQYEWEIQLQKRQLEKLENQIFEIAKQSK